MHSHLYTTGRKYFQSLLPEQNIRLILSTLCFGIICTALVKYFLPGYFTMNTFGITALLIAPYIINPNSSLPISYKYKLLTSIFFILSIISGVKTFYFLTIGFAMFSMIENMAGSIGNLPLFLLCILSPAFTYFNNMLGFPVRLKLSEWAGHILQSIGFKNEVSGNIIVLNGTEFSVDPACVGLKMIAFSLLAGLLMMAYFQRISKKTFSFLLSTGILAIIVILNIFANLIRIVMLTMFKILPDNPLHEILGTICFLVYVIIPSYFIIKWMSRRIQRKLIVTKTSILNLNRTLLINLLLVASITGLGFWKFNYSVTQQVKIQSISLPGYTRNIVGEDVLKFEKPELLVYIKPLSRFYGAEHNPMICWVGSGYQFSRINKELIEGKEIYTGTLKKGNDLIYSAWWFDCGGFKTINQIDWRWRALKGEHFSLVNVNSDNPEMLKLELKNLLKETIKCAAYTQKVH